MPHRVGAPGIRNLAGEVPFTAVPSPILALELKEKPMSGVIYLVGLIVVVMFILSLLGLR
jgi:hypothetical protein